MNKGQLLEYLQNSPLSDDAEIIVNDEMSNSGYATVDTVTETTDEHWAGAGKIYLEGDSGVL